MADIFTSILNIVSVLCSSSANNRCCYLLDLQENKEALNDAMVELKATRDDVKRRIDEAEMNPNELMKRTHEVDSWLQRVQTIEGEVDEILEKVDQEIRGRCFGGYCPKNCLSTCKISKLVIRKLPLVDDLRNKGRFGDVAYKLPPSFVQKEPMDLTVGMESIFEKVWRGLADDEIRIIGLYGCGGVGKTTLLKQINNEFLKGGTTTTHNTHGFDVVILVVVSKAVNIDAIQMEIGNRLGLSSPDRRSIFNALTKKSFLLLLDDIWERVDLQRIGVPHPENHNSKVIFTTRSKTVCGHMDANKKFRVECLPWDKAWTLFQEKLGNEALNSHPKVPELAKVVAKECGGLPLALITIGRAMSTKKTVQEWNYAINTLQRYAAEFPGMGDEVLPILKLSYDSLRNDTIKSCFIHCALFPEDHSIAKEKLIDYWIGEGLILLNESDHIDEARNHGYDVIGTLEGACLLESTSVDGKTHVKMHDVIRDLALWIACECGSGKRDKMLITESFYGTPEKWYNAERIYCSSVVLRYDSTKVPPRPLKSPSLLTLVCERDIHPFSPSLVTQNIFQFMPLLRVLDLSYSHMYSFPTCITDLLELRYLSLSNTAIQALPEELGKLIKLNYLDLSYMKSIKEIPSRMIGSHLLELRVLNLYQCPGADDWDLEEVFNLKHLNDLRISINSQPNLEKILSNKNLQMCMGHLYIRRCLVQRHHLRSSYFQNLSHIEIRYCNSLKDLTWVGYVGSLKNLDVVCCEDLEEMVLVDDRLGGSTGGGGYQIISSNNVEDIFKSLETLNMKFLPKLKSICRNALAFPCLVSLEVSNCPRLKKLPFDSCSNVNNTLQRIEGDAQWWNELRWEEDNDNQVKSKFLPYFQKLFKI